MTKILVIYRKTATEALTHLDEFVVAMDQFVEKNPNHTYEASMKKVGKQWEVKVKIERDEEQRDSITTT